MSIVQIHTSEQFPLSSPVQGFCLNGWMLNTFLSTNYNQAILGLRLYPLIEV